MSCGKKERAKRTGWQKAGKTEEVKRARGWVLVRVSTDSGFSPPSPVHPPLGGYRLTAIRLNLFHHKRLNKEVHSSGPAPAARSALASFRSVGCPYRTLSTTYDHPSRSPPFLKRKVRGCEIATRGYCSLDFFAIQLRLSYADKSS